jgi:hypothetical protein
MGYVFRNAELFFREQCEARGQLVASPVVVQLSGLQGLLCPWRLSPLILPAGDSLCVTSWVRESWWRGGGRYKLTNDNCVLYGMKCSTGHEWKTYELFLRRQPDTCRPSWCHFRSVRTVFLRTLMEQEIWHRRTRCKYVKLTDALVVSCELHDDGS